MVIVTTRTAACSPVPLRLNKKVINMLSTNRKGKWFEITLPEKWNGLSIDDVFRNKWGTPKKMTHFFRNEKKVQVNHKPANWDIPLAAGDKIMIDLFEDIKGEIPPTFLDIPVLYEDEHLIIFNKPANMNTHPNDIELEKNTLLNAAVFYLEAKGEMRNIRHIHRLDRDTTGAILFAKHPLAGAILDQMLLKRKIKRTYIAIVHGLFTAKKGTIQEPIGRDRHHATKRRVSPTGQDAITHFEVLKVDKQKKLTYVKCWLDTGRTHQIRVHFSAIGYPLAGDTLYGGRPIFKRQALHAAKLEFIHPFSEEQITCHAPLMDIPPIFTDIDIFSI